MHRFHEREDVLVVKRAGVLVLVLTALLAHAAALTVASNLVVR